VGTTGEVEEILHQRVGNAGGEEVRAQGGKNHPPDLFDEPPLLVGRGAVAPGVDEWTGEEVVKDVEHALPFRTRVDRVITDDGLIGAGRDGSVVLFGVIYSLFRCPVRLAGLDGAVRGSSVALLGVLAAAARLVAR
jgi:hypothetical protein